MPEISLASRLNPNPCSDGAERANWQNLIEILEIIEQFFHFEITEDNSQYILNIGPIENIETNNINIENFEIGGDIVVNSITAINYYGPGGEICWEHCYCQWRKCLGIDFIPDTLCFEASVDSPDCPDPVSGELVKFRDPCGELVWSTEEDGAVEICCECAPPKCCGVESFPMSPTSEIGITLTGTGTGSGTIPQVAGDGCARFHGTITDLTDTCVGGNQATITVVCPVDAGEEGDISVVISFPGGNCNYILHSLDVTGTGPFAAQAIFRPEVVPGFPNGCDPCDPTDELIVDLLEFEP